MSESKVAVLYQKSPPPVKYGILKPMKPGGYSDSGADIAFSLKSKNICIITPVEHPLVNNDYDWVFPDDVEGIESAMAKGANTFWLNTVLYEGHPIQSYIGKVEIVGQRPGDTDKYDDKLFANNLLRKNNLPVPDSLMVDADNKYNYRLEFSFPVVVKPIRGRGSQGVSMANNQPALDKILQEMFDADLYGTAVYIEPYLKGQEVTLTVMPPGSYLIDERMVIKDKHWSLPTVKRFNHENGIAPYNGVVAIVNNSAVLEECEENSVAILLVSDECAQAGSIIDGKAPIRIDCRADDQGKYFLFDLNMKPNMTGASRPHRMDQDSLTALAARAIGWDFGSLLTNMLAQKWS
ncbi:ATP-grasp domain-containing protein [Pedobacter sp. MC2016-14]|uniref:ATP-grasp domain-containing protein n=1 Tax=Pedobacter sp. MC2016-14 TaxID=2897327 RepID=UPI001E2DCDD3|nr:ATP-grasp domain-containing protein [Pedobacter sp. MC2016-14]MCD0489556.1 ATP-grasp domain-containing protein [Pedobacter sp. MC2016-14]